jgi:hypothetical protein
VVPASRDHEKVRGFDLHLLNRFSRIRDLLALQHADRNELQARIAKSNKPSYFATDAVSSLPPLTHSNIVRYCQLASLPCQRWPPLCVAR